ISPEFAITDFPQSDVEKGFVCTLHGVTWRESRELRHVAHKTNARHVGDEGIVFRHVTDEIPDGLDIPAAHIFAEDGGRAKAGRIKAKECIDESRFAGAVRTEQADGTSRDLAVQLVEDSPLSQLKAKVLEFDNRRHGSCQLSVASCEFAHRNINSNLLSNYALQSPTVPGFVRRSKFVIANMFRSRPKKRLLLTTSTEFSPPYAHTTLGFVSAASTPNDCRCDAVS